MCMEQLAQLAKAPSCGHDHDSSDFYQDSIVSAAGGPENVTAHLSRVSGSAWLDRSNNGFDAGLSGLWSTGHPICKGSPHSVGLAGVAGSRADIPTPSRFDGIHQTWTFFYQVWFEWDDKGMGLGAGLISNTASAAHAGAALMVEDRVVVGRNNALRGLLSRGDSVATLDLFSPDEAILDGVNHAVLTGNGSVVDLYLNRTKVASSAAPATAAVGASNIMAFGDISHPTATLPFDGFLGEPSIGSVYLTESDVQAIFDQGHLP